MNILKIYMYNSENRKALYVVINLFPGGMVKK